MLLTRICPIPRIVCAPSSRDAGLAASRRTLVCDVVPCYPPSWLVSFPFAQTASLGQEVVSVQYHAIGRRRIMTHWQLSLGWGRGAGSHSLAPDLAVGGPFALAVAFSCQREDPNPGIFQVSDGW